MSPKPSLCQWLAVLIPVVLLWSPSFRVQAQAIVKCWVFSPVVDEATIRVEVSTLSSMESGTGRQLWSVSARVSWGRPKSLGSGGAYSVSVVRLPSFKTPQFCVMEEHEQFTSVEQHTFPALDFGFLYEFTVYVLNGTTMAKSLVGISKGFGTPDCFQATGDRNFCGSAAVQYAGAPIEPRLDSQCLQEGALVTAHLSWDVPVQVNGVISAYKLQYTPPDATPGTPATMVTAMPRAKGREMASLPDLTPGSSYTVLISTYVVSPDDGSFNEGLQVELKFRIAANTGGLSVCPSPPPTSPTSGQGLGLAGLQTTGFYNPATAAPAPAQTTTAAGQPRTTGKPPSATVATEAAAGQRPPPPPVRRPSPPTHGATATPPPPPPAEPTTDQAARDVGERPVSSSKRAGVAVAACLVALGLVCALVMLALHVVRGRIADTKARAGHGGQKGAPTPA